MGRKLLFYNLFFPKGKELPFKKFRWTVMIIIQELLMCKYRAVFKYFVKPSYHRDINVLRDILSKHRLTATESALPLSDIHFSHEINYPDRVMKLVKDLKDNPRNYKPIKVFFDESRNKWIVIDGNHRLKAMKNVFEPRTLVKVRVLTYVTENKVILNVN